MDVAGTDDTIEAGEADAEEPRRRLVNWNEYEGRFFTIPTACWIASVSLAPHMSSRAGFNCSSEELSS
jgi:hypothetical protein